MYTNRYRWKKIGLASFMAVLLIFQLTLPYLQVNAVSTDGTTEEAALAENETDETTEEAEDPSAMGESSAESEEKIDETVSISQENDDSTDSSAQNSAQMSDDGQEASIQETKEETKDSGNQMETSEEWSQILNKLELTEDNWVENLAIIAASQIGYKEQIIDSDASGDNMSRSWTRYGIWYGDPYEAWNTLFAGFCLHYAEVKGVPFEPKVTDWVKELKKESVNLYVSAEDAKPKRGDLVFLDLEKSEEEPELHEADTVGIVKEVEYDSDLDQWTQLTVVLGDYEDKVAEVKFEVADSKIVGFASIPVDPRSVKEKEAESEKTVTFEEMSGDVRVTVQAPEGAFPEGTSMIVTEVQPADVVESVDSAVDGTVTRMEAVDISFINAEGEEIEPLLPIHVVIGSPLIEEKKEDLTVVHVPDQEDASVVALTEEEDVQTDEVAFEAESFSVYAVAYTVDFALTDKDGNTYTFALEGGKQITLSELFVMLGAMDEETSKKLVSEDVESVSFTNEELVKVVPIEEDTTLANILTALEMEAREGAEEESYFAPDYLLMSLQSFETDELLTITLKSGLEVVVKVTDPPSSTSSSWIPPEINTINAAQEGVRINLFNYEGRGRVFDHEGNYWEAEHDIDSTENKIGNVINGGINSQGSGFYFLGSGASAGSPGDYSTRINNYTGGFGDAYKNYVMQNIVRNTLVDGYPALAGGNWSSLAYLFNENSIGGAKTAYTGLNGLLKKDPVTGEFSYDSDKNYAYYDAGQKKIVVYDQTYNIHQADWGTGNYLDDGKAIGFFPFNQYDSNQRVVYPTGVGRNGNYENHYDHQFGLTVEADFFIPTNKKISYESSNGEKRSDDMKFTFSGDDDVWVFVDDVLVLDLGGVHGAASGSINFTTGEVKVDTGAMSANGNAQDAWTSTTIAKMFEKAGKTYNDAEYTEHTLKFFYLERGGIYSNCKIDFNLQTYVKKDLTIGKQVRSSEGMNPDRVKNEEYTFSVEIGTGTETNSYQNVKTYFGVDGRKQPYVTNQKGNKLRDLTFEDDGTFKLKATERVVLPELPDSLQYRVTEKNIDSSKYVEAVQESGKTMSQLTRTILTPQKSEGQATFIVQSSPAPIKDNLYFVMENVMKYYELPSSGGMGTYLFTFIGALFIALGVVAYRRNLAV